MGHVAVGSGVAIQRISPKMSIILFSSTKYSKILAHLISTLTCGVILSLYVHTSWVFFECPQWYTKIWSLNYGLLWQLLDAFFSFSLKMGFWQSPPRYHSAQFFPLHLFNYLFIELFMKFDRRWCIYIWYKNNTNEKYKFKLYIFWKSISYIF